MEEDHFRVEKVESELESLRTRVGRLEAMEMERHCRRQAAFGKAACRVSVLEMEVARLGNLTEDSDVAQSAAGPAG
jgi:hypothetical protein